MDKGEFSKIRRFLEKTQLQMAQLLGTSHKSIQSFEQGWRKIPVHVERQMLLLAAMKGSRARKTPCWESTDCPSERRLHCPAWELQCGNLCWFINGTICKGEVQESWKKKMELCRRCRVFRSTFSSVLEENRSRAGRYGQWRKAIGAALYQRE